MSKKKYFKKHPNDVQQAAPVAANEAVEVQAKVIETLPNANFTVQLESGKTILAHISGRMRKNFIRILAGDTVQVELSPYDLSKGRITYRHK